MNQPRLKNHLPIEVVEATIPINTALSDVLNIGDFTVVALEMPSAWTAAAISFKGATPLSSEEKDSGLGAASLKDIYNGATELSYAVAASRVVLIDNNLFSGITQLQLRSGVTATPVNQLAERKVRVYLRPVLK